ncbi:hypothetical protein BH23CHL5_BH23CHL5_17870 [soil metagenome]
MKHRSLRPWCAVADTSPTAFSSLANLGSLNPRSLKVPRPFSLRHTVAPVAWARGRWPNVDWIENTFVWVGWESDRLVTRGLRQQVQSGTVIVSGSGLPENDLGWLEAVLGIGQTLATFDIQTLDKLSSELAGLCPYANGSLFDGVIGSIVGQSISVAAAATVERRLAALVHSGLAVGDRTFFPFPRARDLAELTPALVRGTGVTWRRAEAIVAIAKTASDGNFPLVNRQQVDPDSLRKELRLLPLVGPWTAESAMLWGLGLPDIYPTGDVALLRAARLAYDSPDMTMAELDRLSLSWAPQRSWAARLLWTNLLGSAPG